MTSRLPLPFCPFPDNQVNQHPEDVRIGAQGERIYTLPLTLSPDPSISDVERLEAALHEANAHVRTLTTQLWMWRVAQEWESQMGSRVETLGVQWAIANEETDHKDEARFRYQFPAVSGYMNSRGHWITRGTDADLTDIDRSNIKILRDLLVDVPTDAMSLHLLDLAFGDTPDRFIEMTLDTWRACISRVVPEAIAPAVHSHLLDATLSPAQSGPRPRL